MPTPDHVLAQPKMVVLGCATTRHVLAQPGEIKMVVLGCAKTGPVLAQPRQGCARLCKNGTRFSTT